MNDGPPGRFDAYYRKTAGAPPRATVLRALESLAVDATAEGHAVDLGCGTGRDTRALLDAGLVVTAIDAEPSALETLRRSVPASQRGRLRTVCGRFETLTWAPADLVVASFSLPLCAPAEFDAVWARIRAGLRPGGRFAGQWFGDRDQWNGQPGVTCVSRGRALELLDGLRVEHFEEEEGDGVTPRGREKHWHLFHVVVQRPPGD